DAAIIHLGVDPLFVRYPMRSFPCDVPILAEPAAALPLLTEAVRRLAAPSDVAARTARTAALHRARRAEWTAMVEAQRGWKTIGFAEAAAAVAEVLDEGTVVVNEYPLDRRFIGFDRPGAFFGSPHASGLGWGLPAALRIQRGNPQATGVTRLARTRGAPARRGAPPPGARPLISPRGRRPATSWRGPKGCPCSR